MNFHSTSAGEGNLPAVVEKTSTTRRRVAMAAVVAALTTVLMSFAGLSPASAAVQQSASRASGDCTMQAFLDRDAGGVRAVGSVTCASWHPSVTAHVHLQYYAPSYWNPVEQNHYYNLLIGTWGPFSGYGVNGLSTGKATGCAYWRAETQMSLTNSMPTSQQYVATQPVYLCA